MTKILLALLVSQPSGATICLRAPQVSATEFREWVQSHPQCQNSEETLFRQMQTDPDHDLEILGNRLRRTNGGRRAQIEILKDFFERKKEQAWSKRTVDVVVEVLKRWSAEAGEPPELQRMIEQLEQSVETTPPTVQLSDWSDAIIYRNANRTSGIGGSEPQHWVVFSSLYRPLIVWGRSDQLISKMTLVKRPWLTGTCEKPGLNFNTTAAEDYLFLYPNGCVASRPSLVNPITTSQPTIVTMTAPKKAFYESPVFWGVTAVSAILISAALRNKSVTIRSALK